LASFDGRHCVTELLRRNDVVTLIQANATPNGKYSNVPNELFDELARLAIEGYSNGQRSPKEHVKTKTISCTEVGAGHGEMPTMKERLAAGDVG
jgi:hypothetical protein